MFLRHRIAFAYVFILCLATGIVVKSVYLGLSVDKATQDFVDVRLRSLMLISDLQQNFVEVERQFYEYYATAYQPGSMLDVKAQLDVIEEDLRQLKQLDVSSQMVEKVSALYTQFVPLAVELDTALQEGTRDWDRAREVLNLASSIGHYKILPLLQQTSAEIRQQTSGAAQQTRVRAQSTTRLVSVFAVFVLILSATIAFYVNRYLHEGAQRRKLVQFVHTSPDAVLTVDFNGNVEYQNPAVDLLNASLKSADSCLPEDLVEKIQRMRDSNQGFNEWSYRREHLDLHCRLTVIADFNQCHLHIRNVSAQVQAEKKLQSLVYNDQLTGLPNRYQLGLDIQQMVEGPEGIILLMFWRPDNFQRIAASNGYDVGQLLLVELSKRLCESIPGNNSNMRLYRLEAEQFAFISWFPSSEVAQVQTQRLVARAREMLVSAVVVGERQFYISSSSGYVVRQSRSAFAEELLRDADLALRVSIEGDGSDQCREFTVNMARVIERRNNVEHALREALEKNELQLYLQPQCETVSKRVLGYEALLRWHSKAFGSVSPGEFIPLAESSGLIVKIGRWVLSEACNIAAQWYQQGHREFKVAVNVSSKQFLDPNFVDTVRQSIEVLDGHQRLIELEITESAVIHDTEHCIAILEELKALGLTLAMDDFGTGYSSLSYLRRLPLDKLKIDQSFIRPIKDDQSNLEVVDTIIKLAKNMGMDVLAEGVETEHQRQTLAHLDCHEFQGFLVSPPLPSDEVIKRFPPT